MRASNYSLVFGGDLDHHVLHVQASANKASNESLRAMPMPRDVYRPLHPQAGDRAKALPRPWR
jgi:hypothetical protein